MNPFLFTITFLTLIGILTSSEVVKYTHESFNQHLFKGHVAADLEREKIIQTSYFEDYRLQESENPIPKTSSINPTPAPHKKNSTSLNFNHIRPPNNSRLNFFLLLSSSEKAFHYETAAILMRSLYGKMDFFNKIPNAEFEILDALIAKKDETLNFTYPDELATIDLSNHDLQKIFVAMLKGGNGYPSLLHYITFDSKGSSFQQKVNFMFLSPELLYAICPKASLATDLLTLQEQAWVEINYQEQNKTEFEECKGRTELKKDLLEAFTQTVQKADIDTDAFVKLFDFSLGKPGNILFIKDIASNIVQREKYIKKVRS